MEIVIAIAILLIGSGCGVALAAPLSTTGKVVTYERTGIILFLIGVGTLLISAILAMLGFVE